MLWQPKCAGGGNRYFRTCNRHIRAKQNWHGPGAGGWGTRIGSAPMPAGVFWYYCQWSCPDVNQGKRHSFCLVLLRDGDVAFFHRSLGRGRVILSFLRGRHVVNLFPVSFGSPLRKPPHSPVWVPVVRAMICSLLGIPIGWNSFDRGSNWI